jgi:4-hydroxybenzoate polyprenyltransferase
MLAWPIGTAALVIASLAIAASALYSWRWKNTLLLGNASVAVVVAAVLPFGALATGGITAPVWIAALLTALFVLAQESLFTLEDEASDRAAGLATTATRLGPLRAARWVRRLFGAFAGVALLPWALGAASDAYALAVAALTVAPVLALIRLLREPVRAGAVAAAARASRYIWLTSFVPLGLLR